jgi:hypothetical protein
MLDTNQYKLAKHSVEIDLPKSPAEVFDHLTQLSEWWPEDFVGGPIHPNAEFVFQTGEGHHSRNKVIDFVPGHKLSWVTTESLRKADNFDWTGTKMIFELVPKGNATLLRFTYDGVVLDNESDRLVHICDMTVNNFFYNFLIHGKARSTALASNP